MSVGNVVMVFEGTYAQYLNDQVPTWARAFPAGIPPYQDEEFSFICMRT